MTTKLCMNCQAAQDGKQINYGFGVGVCLGGNCGKTDLSIPEPPPVANNLPAVWDLVMADMKTRDHSGYLKYGRRLQPHNGRSALVDAYQEALDLAVYLRSKIFEETGK